MQKALFYNETFLGFLGEKTGYDIVENGCKVELFVGDLISFETYGENYVRALAKDEPSNRYGIFGFGTNDLNFNNIRKVLPYELLTEEIFQHTQRGREAFMIKEIENCKELTLGEVEQMLGYKVKIINQ